MQQTLGGGAERRRGEEGAQAGLPARETLFESKDPVQPETRQILSQYIPISS